MIRHKTYKHSSKFFHLLIIQFVLSIVTSQYWGQFFILTSFFVNYHIYIYTPIKAEIKSGYHILFYRRNGICRDLLTRGALFTQPSVCTILADPIRTRCRGRDGLPLVGYSESSRRESDMSLGYISYTHACYLCIRLCNLYVIWSEIVYLAFTARCTLRFRYERIQSTVAVNVT